MELLCVLGKLGFSLQKRKLFYKERDLLQLFSTQRGFVKKLGGDFLAEPALTGQGEMILR